MTFKTHVAAGITSALLIAHPSKPKDIILCVGAAAIGSVISDIDATTSESKKGLKKVTGVTLCAVAAIIAADYFLDARLWTRFMNNSNLVRCIFGFFALILVCIFGERQPHRSFMHSIAGLAAVTGSVYFMWPQASLYTATAMASHILIDMLNKKRIQLFYPLKRPRAALGICYSDGLVNSLLFMICSIASIAVIAIYSYEFVKGTAV
ncbi:MAG: metal-dependent hydrolase [Oscillospiraceae bacterium]|nr:metal-dependent hydrolase [Oscillospiraceae bacterium]